MKGLVRLAIVAALTGCTAWRTEALEPARFRADTAETVRLVLRSGDTVMVRSAAIKGDTVIGVQRAREVRVPLSDVAHADVRDVSTPRSLAFIGGLGLLMAGIEYLALVSGGAW